MLECGPARVLVADADEEAAALEPEIMEPCRELPAGRVSWGDDILLDIPAGEEVERLALDVAEKRVREVDLDSDAGLTTEDPGEDGSRVTDVHEITEPSVDGPDSPLASPARDRDGTGRTIVGDSVVADGSTNPSLVLVTALELGILCVTVFVGGKVEVLSEDASTRLRVPVSWELEELERTDSVDGAADGSDDGAGGTPLLVVARELGTFDGATIEGSGVAVPETGVEARLPVRPESENSDRTLRDGLDATDGTSVDLELFSCDA